MPSRMVWPTLWMVACTRSSRSMYGTIRTPLGRELGIQLVDLGVDAAQGLRRILVLEHQHDALDRVGIAVLAEDAFALLVAQRGAAEVAHQHRRAVHCVTTIEPISSRLWIRPTPRIT